MSWRRCVVLVGQLVTDPVSAVYRDAAGDAAGWRLPEVLMSRVVNAVEYANFLAYQMNKDKGAPDWPVPEAIYPPWMTKPAAGKSNSSGRGERKFQGGRMSIEEVNEWLGW